ncbi:glycosyltransferase family 2 protein [Sutcliffiella sp. NC1]|uniref:glycosyltransferase family 2 protein n=1 Tax=Sutcliffiella sp. NC1 TaxID=3004096 RepID=UPI0022DD60B3|nr:glycosyltransferase [Sutcliffiella sp. NC1]WBL14826.1 glycosyltransferase [Sutcliffiella sp. NC1]
MKVEYLISTMYKSDYKFINDMNINSDATIINQTDFYKKQEYETNRGKIKFISTTDRGLSKSRNLAIKNASGDICVLCDDDIKHYDNSVEVIKKAYLENSEADIIVFAYHTKGRHKKNFTQKSSKINYLSAMKISSVQITFKRKSILEKGILFNEQFGTGSSVYQSGEENIFLFECLKKGLKIYYEPQYILQLEENGESSWFRGFNEKYMLDRGAIFTAMSKKFSLALILQFAIRRYNLYKNSMGLFMAIKYMLNGRKRYLSIGKKNK